MGGDFQVEEKPKHQRNPADDGCCWSYSYQPRFMVEKRRARNVELRKMENKKRAEAEADNRLYFSCRQATKMETGS